MPRAVQLSAYGDVDQLKIVDLPKPQPKRGEALVRVVAAGTNPGEIAIRTGALAAMFPKAFPFGQGTDFAGRVEAAASDVRNLAAGDEVIGWTFERNAQADYVVVPADHVVRKPPSLDWYRAGSLFVVATTATAAVRAVSLRKGDVVAVGNAAGGVGSIAVQLALRAGARVLGIASAENAPFLRSVGVEPVTYGDGLADRLRALAPNGIDAFIDLFGGGYVELALGLGVAPDRIDTIIDFEAAQKHHVKAEGSAEAASPDVVGDVAELIAWGAIVMPLTAVYPFAMVRDAYVELGKRKARGKIVLALDDSVSEVLHVPPSAR